MWRRFRARMSRQGYRARRPVRLRVSRSRRWVRRRRRGRIRHWRVGGRQDLLTLNIDLASVMQAGRWKSTRMPMRYGEEVLAARGGMARAAQAQGRDTYTADS